MTMTEDAHLNVIDTGIGAPILFQHGLGGDRHQVADSFPPQLACRRITLECRGHGLSGADPQRRYSIARFADDLLLTADRLGLQRFALGGISMGAAIALRIACRHPERVTALALVRPAWLTEPAPDNMTPFVAVSEALKTDGKAGRDRFAGSPVGLQLAQHGPDNLASLLGFFGADDPDALADLLLAIALDGPDITRHDMSRLTMPVITVGHGIDVVHPLAYAHQLAAWIPGARCVEITPKATDKQAYRTELHTALSTFFTSSLEESRR